MTFEILEDRLVPSGGLVDPTYAQWSQETFTVHDMTAQVQTSSADLHAQWMQDSQLIGVDKAWSQFPYRGDGYSVAVIDTGIDYTHPALAGRVVAGWNFVANNGNYMDDNGHGTHVAGIIASDDPTYPGIAPDANLIALKVLDASGSGTFGSVDSALKWVALHQQQYNIVAINMSLGAGNYASNPFTFLDPDFTALVNEGVFISVASGNDYYVDNSQQGLAFPAIDPQVVSVGAVWDGNFGTVKWQDGAIDYVTAPDLITSFTERSPALDLLAPGAMITSTYPGGGFQTMAGTSMAAPVVAGAAVLLHQELDAVGQHALANESHILSLMQSTGVSIQDNAYGDTNTTPSGLTFRRLNLYAAMDAVASPAAPVQNNVFGDSGFESFSVGTGTWGSFRYRPGGTPWSYTGWAGVAGNQSGFTQYNPNAPEGTQVGFIQQNGSMSQQVLFSGGTYDLNFSAAQRAYWNAGRETIRILVDGQVVDTITPGSSSYSSYTTQAFQVYAGMHTITFAGLNPGGDNTAFIDQVTLNVLPGDTFMNSGFENVPLGSAGWSNFRYDPTGASWSFNGLAGIAGNGSGFTFSNPNAPEGSQVAFVQDNGSFSQTVRFSGGVYTISFQAAQRGSYQSSHQTIQILVDGMVVDTITPNGTSYSTYTTRSFQAAAGMHTVTFVGLNPNGGDNTALIDQAALNVLQGDSLMNSGFENGSVGSGGWNNFRYDPSGAGWSFNGLAGIAGNGSGFTFSNPNASEGSQVAFLQDNGSFSQTVQLSGGTYSISFLAAQRGSYQSSRQTFEVLVDGMVVASITPGSSQYSSYTTNSFLAGQGLHTVTFVGLNPNGGDNTALIDQVQLIKS